jgi:hypothetical protein
MDWIERWFGVAPDNGDGSLETLILLCAIVASIAAFAYFHPRTRAYLASLVEHARQRSPRIHR